MNGHDDGGCVNCGGVASATSHRGAAYDASIPDRVRALALDIAHRLRAVCAHMPDDELHVLAMRMARVELKYFEGSATTSTRRQAAIG